MTDINWQTVYSDLPTRIANALRKARIHPDKLPQMTDGEILAIDGIGDKALEIIRQKYPAGEKIALKEEEVKPETPTSQPQDKSTWPANKRHLFANGKRIRQARAQVDKTKLYPLPEAVALVKKTNIARFTSTITLHLNLKDKLPRVEVVFPYSTGKSKRIAIVTEDTLAKIAKGQLDFDILIATPAMMPKLAKYARLLGPRGLMPNPKMGTVTPNPAKKKQELESGLTIIKAEPKFPIMHVNVGKTDQKDEHIVANIQAVLQAVKPKNIKSAYLAATMSPSVKIQL